MKFVTQIKEPVNNARHFYYAEKYCYNCPVCLVNNQHKVCGPRADNSNIT